MPQPPSFDVDSLDEPEEDDEESSEGFGAVPEPPPEPGPTRVRKPTTRAGRTQFERRKPPASAEWAEQDAEALWPEVLSTLGKTGHAYQGNSAWDFEARVVRISPPPRETVNRIDCGALVGDGSINPGDLLVRMVDDFCHLPTPTLGECKYEINFVWKAGPAAGKRIARGILVRPPAQEILARRSAGIPSQMTMGGAPMPPAYYPQAPTQGYYPAPPPAQGGPGPDRYLIEQLVHQLNETRRENATLRGQPVPPPIAAPAAAPMSEDSIVEKLFQRIAPTLGRAAGAGLGAAAGVPTGSRFETMMGNFFGQAMEATMKHVASKFEAGLKGEPMELAGTEPAPAAAIPENPEDKLPFHQVKLGGKWGDGREAFYTPSKDGSGPFGLHLGGFLASNPFVIEKINDVASGGVQRMTNAVATVVERMTHGAVSGAPQVGVGQAPSSPPPPPPAPIIDTTGTEVAPTMPAPAPNGHSGWPQA